MSATVEAHRLPDNPIITPSTAGYDAEKLGDNINGPSLIRVPDWLPNPLGKYYLYFANHGGKHIRLAYADHVEGPWRIYEPGTLHLDQTNFWAHIASPDVHVDHEQKRIRMYFHGPITEEERLNNAFAEVDHPEGPFYGNQYTGVALSHDGINFDAQPQKIASFYFRVFEHEGWHYGIAMPMCFYRSRDGLTNWEHGPAFFDRKVRHTAVQKDGNTLRVFFSQREVELEHIMMTTLDISGDWFDWQATEPVTILKPEMDWEGANEPVVESRSGSAKGPVHQLRDPCIFEDEGRAYLLYSVAGECGIAIAELR